MNRFYVLCIFLLSKTQLTGNSMTAQCDQTCLSESTDYGRPMKHFCIEIHNFLAWKFNLNFANPCDNLNMTILNHFGPCLVGELNFFKLYLSLSLSSFNTKLKGLWPIFKDSLKDKQKAGRLSKLKLQPPKPKAKEKLLIWTNISAAKNQGFSLHMSVVHV